MAGGPGALSNGAGELFGALVVVCSWPPPTSSQELLSQGELGLLILGFLLPRLGVGICSFGEGGMPWLDPGLLALLCTCDSSWALTAHFCPTHK